VIDRAQLPFVMISAVLIDAIFPVFLHDIMTVPQCTDSADDDDVVQRRTERQKVCLTMFLVGRTERMRLEMR